MWFSFLFGRQRSDHSLATSRTRTRRPTRRQSSGIRLGVESLETRWCPSCTVFQKGDLLVIQGDQADNSIALADHRDKVRVTCDGHIMLFSRIRRFAISTGEGNDFVSIKKQRFPATFNISTGAGNDRVVGEFSWGASPTFRFRTDLGNGNDSLAANFIPVEQIIPVEQFVQARRGLVDVQALGGGGLDRIRLSMAPARAKGLVNANVNIDIDGGRLPSVQNVTFKNTDIAGAVNLHSTGRDAADRVGFIIEGGKILGALDLGMNLGAGSDTGSIIIDSGKIHGTVDIGLGTGGGNDTGSIIVQNGSELLNNLNVAMSMADGKDAVGIFVNNGKIEGAVNLGLDTGVGDDIGTVSFVNSTAGPGGVNAHIAAGSGFDDIRTIFAFNPQPDPPGEPFFPVFLTLLGGADDDELGLSVFGSAGHLEGLDAMLDGGDGVDVARVTSNVLTDVLFRDVEEILQIE